MADTIKGWGLQLNGQDNRDIRFCIRRCRLGFVGINECGVPLIETILPYAAKNPTILKALIALSTRQRRTKDETSQNIATAEFYSDQYQSALEGLRLEMAQLSRSGLHNESKVSGILASALLLSLFGFPESNSGWTQHISGMISIIDSVDLSILVSNRLGRFLLSFSSHLDISAFSLGRTEKSHHAWLKRHLGLPESPIPYDESQRAHGVFSPLEVIVAYPETLTAIIAVLSQESENQVEKGIRQSTSSSDSRSREGHVKSYTSVSESASSKISAAWSGTHLLATHHQAISLSTNNLAISDWRDEGEFQRTEKLIEEWTPPVLPHTLTSDLRLALSTAWEVFRKAAFIFHWRGRGFYSDLRVKIRHDRSARTSVYVREIIASVRSLVSMANDKGFVIGNTMLWPMAVIACECDTEANGWQSEVYSLFEDIQKTFALGQVAYLKQVLQILWNRKAAFCNIVTDTSVEPLSLEGISRELKLTIPLF